MILGVDTETRRSIHSTVVVRISSLLVMIGASKSLIKLMEKIMARAFGSTNKRHHLWAGGLSSLTTADDILRVSEEDRESMKRWLIRNMKIDIKTG